MARLDSELVARGIARSRQRAKEMIEAGNVTVNGIIAKKASAEVNSEDIIESSEEELYVGRGALKIEKAAEEFGIEFTGRICMDIGASTGGFTDFMLSRGAARVFAVDVGHGQLAEKLRSDSRVVNMEGTDIRSLTKEDIDGSVDIISVDVSFISLRFILPKVYEFLNTDGEAAVLIKPQFEAGRSDIGKNGVVKDRKVHLRVLREIDDLACETGFVCEKYTYSPVKGGSGNTEYLVHLRKNGSGRKVHDLKALVESAFEKL